MIASKQFPSERLNYVWDIFLFSCYNGLAYADVKKLKRSEAAIGVDGEKWIFTPRKKTDTSTRIPLLPTSLEILNQYADHPQCVNEDRRLMANPCWHLTLVAMRFILTCRTPTDSHFTPLLLAAT